MLHTQRSHRHTVRHTPPGPNHSPPVMNFLGQMSKNTGRLGRFPNPAKFAGMITVGISISAYVLLIGEWLLTWTLSPSDWRWVSGTYFVSCATVLIGACFVFSAAREAAGGVDGRKTGKDPLTVGGSSHFRSMDNSSRVLAQSFSLFFTTLILFIQYNLDPPKTAEGVAAAAAGILSMRIVLLGVATEIISKAHMTIAYSVETSFFTWLLDLVRPGPAHVGHIDDDDE